LFRDRILSIITWRVGNMFLLWRLREETRKIIGNPSNKPSRGIFLYENSYEGAFNIDSNIDLLYT
jgi:hypothetical protein